MSPNTILRFGGDVFRLQGMLSDPYRLLLTDSTRERHPSERWRQAGWAEISQYMRPVEASAVFTYRYYFDDWGISSNTGTLKLNKYVTSNLIASPEYRYYIQTEADFGKYAQNAAAGTYGTADYKLKAFDSNNIGLGLTYFLRGVAARKSALDFLGGATISAMYFRYWNSLRFNADVVETKIKFGF